MADPVPTTRLEAVNRMLATIGISRLADLTATDREDQNEAEATLDEVTREVQMRGWAFNQDVDYPLTAASNKFAIPTNAMQVTFPRGLYQGRFTTRKDPADATVRVWDRLSHTFTIADHTILYVGVTWGFEFDGLPEAARWYITVRAARQFADRMLAGQQAIGAFSEADERDALSYLKEAEGETEQYTIFDSPDMVGFVDRDGGLY